MALSMAMDVLVVSVDDMIDSSLQRKAERHGWALLQSLPVRQVMRQVLACHPRVVIVQVSKITDQALQLVRLLQSSWRKVATIVAAREHNEAIEREARMAGCTAYLPEAEAEALVDQYVDMICEPASSGASADLSLPADLPAARFDPEE